MKKLILIIILFASCLFGQERREFKYRLNDFRGGLDKETSVLSGKPKNTCEILYNAVIEFFGIETRKGIDIIPGLPSSVETQKLFTFEKADGAKYLIALTTDTLRFTIDLENWTVIKTGLSWTLNPMQMAVYDNKAWFTNGINNVFYFDGAVHSGNYYEEFDFIPKGKYICSHGNVLFLANVYGGTSRLYYCTYGSDATNEESWPRNQYAEIGYQDGDVVTGLYSYGDLMIFKRNSVWSLFGTWETDWQISKLYTEYGCRYQESICIDKGVLKYISDKGLIMYNGNFQKIDYPIKSEIQDSNTMEGEYRFIQLTSATDFAAGTESGVEVTGNEIKLEESELSYTWEDFEVVDGTFTNTGVVQNYITLNTTATWTSSQSTITISIEQQDCRSKELYGVYIADGQYKDLMDDYSYLFESGKQYIYEDPLLNITNASDDDTRTAASVEKNKLEKNEILVNKVSGIYMGAEISITTRDGEIIKKEFKKPETYSYIGATYEFICSFEKQYITKLYLSGVAHLFYQESNLGIRAGYTSRVNRNFGAKPVVYVYGKSLLTAKWDLIGKKDWTSLRVYRGWRPIDAQPKDDFEIDVQDFYTNKIKIVIAFSPEGIPPDGDYTGYVTFTLFNDLKLYSTDDVSEYISYETNGKTAFNIHDFGYRLRMGTWTAAGYGTAESTITYHIKLSTDGTNYSALTLIENDDDIVDTVGSDYALSRYMGVVSSFTTTISSYTPVLYEMRVEARKSSGSWISAKQNVEKVANWKYFVADDEQSLSGETISYYVRFASSSAGLDSDSWININSGDLIPAASTDTWCQVRAILEGDNPIVYSVTLTYAPDADAIIPCSYSVNNRWWLGISTVTSSSDNDVTIVHDKNNAFIEYTLQPNSIVYHAGKYYMASSTSSAIYEIETGISDNGDTIELRYEKTTPIEENDHDKHLEYMYLTCDKETSGTINFTWYLGNSTTINTRSIDISGTGKLNKREGLGSHSGYRTFKIGLNSTANPTIQELTLYGYYEPLR